MCGPERHGCVGPSLPFVMGGNRLFLNSKIHKRAALTDCAVLVRRGWIFLEKGDMRCNRGPHPRTRGTYPVRQGTGALLCPTVAHSSRRRHVHDEYEEGPNLTTKRAGRYS